MSWRQAFPAAVILLLSSCSSPGSVLLQGDPKHTDAKWSDRGVFSFKGLVFDFHHRRFGIGPARGPLANCSDAEFYCAHSDIFSLVLPRDCKAVHDVAVGHTWSLGNVRTRVLHVEVEALPPIHGGSGKVLYLGSEERKNVLYAYDPSIGVTTIFWDPSGRMDFFNLAVSDGVESWKRNLADDPLKANKTYPLSSFDPFGKCL